VSGARRAISWAALLLLAAAAAPAEPIFLSRQYSRCTNCHYSPTGGGLLTPYGRSLSAEELSTTGAHRGATTPGREQEFLYGVLGDAIRPVSLGIDLRPSHLDISSGGYSSTLDFFMNAELTAAAQAGGFTFYGELGRQPRGGDTRVASFEHWVSYKAPSGLGVRAGRFLPAYGVHFADHTAFTRAPLLLDNENQVYALELSYSGDRQLVQVSAGPGFADSVGHADERAFTASARWQYDLRPRLVLVASGLYRAASDVAARNGATGLALGTAPLPHLTLWVQGDARFQEVRAIDQGGAQPPGNTAYTLLADAAYEVYRGVWLRVSPQLLTAFGDTSAGETRIAAELNLLPRTHWNVGLAYYHDRDRHSGVTSRTLLAQLHLYL
jgi:hypothetical protein